MCADVILAFSSSCMLAHRQNLRFCTSQSLHHALRGPPPFRQGRLVNRIVKPSLCKGGWQPKADGRIVSKKSDLISGCSRGRLLLKNQGGDNKCSFLTLSHTEGMFSVRPALNFLTFEPCFLFAACFFKFPFTSINFLQVLFYY